MVSELADDAAAPPAALAQPRIVVRGMTTRN